MEAFDKFHQERTQDFWGGHYSGVYRGIVVETNDPLRMHRIRVKVLDLYNQNEKTENILWATMANWFGGGPSAGSWVSASIGDFVWVTFERGHPYNPVVVGFADPTRIKNYVLDSIYGPPPVPFDEKGEISEKPEYSNEDYLPKDQRPYSMGFKSPYGQEVILNYTGFFPETHKEKPVESGVDAVSSKDFQSSTNPPEPNKPDTKYMAFISGYGTTLIMHDAGHDWQKEINGNKIKDEQYQIDRYKYNLEFLNESKAEGKDQRRFEVRTRAGHKIELRDVGFNKSRQGEYGNSIALTDKTQDERWIKHRTKGGHLFQMIDIGFDAEQDQFYKRLNKTESGADVENENLDLEGQDKRLIRIQTRHGNRMLFDDRGSDSTEAHIKEEPRGIGISIQTRRGHYLGLCDRDEYNAIALQSARGQGMFISDKDQYVALSTETAERISPVREGAYGAEWPTAPWRKTDPETNTHHLVLDNKNQAARLKTPKLQGLEFRDGNPESTEECSKPAWAEMRDIHDRGIYFNSDQGYFIMRGKPEKKDTTATTTGATITPSTTTNSTVPVATPDKYTLINVDTSRETQESKKNKSKQWIVVEDNDLGQISVRNETGTIKIMATDNTVFIGGKNIAIEALENITLRAGKEITLQAAQVSNPTHWTVKGGSVGTNKLLTCETMEGRHLGIRYEPGPAQAPPVPMQQPEPQPKVEEKEVSEHKPEDEKPDPCKSGEYKDDQKKADDAKKKAFDSKKKAEDAYNKALDSRKNANSKLKSLHNERMSGGSSSSGYQQAKTEADAAVKQFKDDKGKAKEAIDENKKDYDDYVQAQETANNRCAKEKCDDAKEALKQANAEYKRASTARDGDKEGDLEKRKEEAKKKVDEAKKKEKQACEKKKGARNTKRGCAPNKAESGDIPSMGGGGGPGGNTPPSGGGGGTPPVDPPEVITPSADEFPESDVLPPPPYEPNPPDPLSDESPDGGNGGVLWYGVSETWLQEIVEKGILLSSLANNKNDPSNLNVVSEFIELASRIETAKGKDFVELSQRRYGGRGVILRIKAVEDTALLIENQINSDPNPANETIKTFNYIDNILPEYIEVYEIIPELPSLLVPIIKK